MNHARSRLLCSVLFEGMGETVIQRVPSASWADERDRLVWSTLEKLHTGGRPTDAEAVSASLRRLNPWVVDYLADAQMASWPSADAIAVTLLFVQVHLLEAGNRTEKRKTQPRWLPLGPSGMWSREERKACAAKMQELIAVREAEERR